MSIRPDRWIREMCRKHPMIDLSKKRRSAKHTSSYKDRKGKYQAQRGITLPRL